MVRRTDEALMDAFSKGQKEAMSELFDRYQLRIYNFYFQRTKDKDISEDLTQNVFYKVLKYGSSYKMGKFESWIFKIARNLFLDHYRKESKFRKVDQDNAFVESSDEQDLEKAEAIEKLSMVLKALNEEEIRIIELNRIQGLKYEEVAERIGSSAGAVKVKVHRILKKIRTHYFKEEAHEVS